MCRHARCVECRVHTTRARRARVHGAHACACSKATTSRGSNSQQTGSRHLFSASPKIRSDQIAAGRRAQRREQQQTLEALGCTGVLCRPSGGGGARGECGKSVSRQRASQSGGLGAAGRACESGPEQAIVCGGCVLFLRKGRCCEYRGGCWQLCNCKAIRPIWHTAFGHLG